MSTITEDDIKDLGWTTEEILEGTDDFSEYYFESEQRFREYIGLVLTPSFHEIREIERYLENPKCSECLESDETVDPTLKQEYDQRVSFREDENVEIHDLIYECEEHGTFVRYIENISEDEL